MATENPLAAALYGKTTSDPAASQPTTALTPGGAPTPTPAAGPKPQLSPKEARLYGDDFRSPPWAVGELKPEQKMYTPMSGVQTMLEQQQDTLSDVVGWPTAQRQAFNRQVV